MSKIILLLALLLSCQGDNDFTSLEEVVTGQFPLACLNFYGELDHPDYVQEDIKKVVCDFLLFSGATYVHHSGYRGPLRNSLHSYGETCEDERHGVKKSQHDLGKALDFRISSYQGMDREERVCQFLEDWEMMFAWLDDLGHIDRMGIGCYHTTTNPFFHWDTRGSKARWCRINGKYVGLEKGLTQAAEECPRIEEVRYY